jgi:hypothetical protein
VRAVSPETKMRRALTSHLKKYPVKKRHEILDRTIAALEKKPGTPKPAGKVFTSSFHIGFSKTRAVLKRRCECGHEFVAILGNRDRIPTKCSTCEPGGETTWTKCWTRLPDKKAAER